MEVPILTLNKELKSQVQKHKDLVAKQGSAHLILPGQLIDSKNILPEAAQVISRLHAAKFQAFLVGGGVRDLLLGKQPKDFDVVTNATPEQIKKIFSRCRIVGRRFKLAHVIFNNIIIEVATFRKSIQAEKASVSADGMVLRDNLYGSSIAEDAARRDFTINSLYYSPITNEIHDFHGGFYDILHGQIDIIGDPEQRYREDPVRMIRAYRFAAKLNFAITARTKQPIPQLLPLLSQIPPARMFEEVNKLFLTGHGATSFEITRKEHVLEYLLLEHGTLIDSPEFYEFVTYALKSSDERHSQGKRNMPHFLYAVMLWPITYQLYKHMLKLEKFAVMSAEDIMLQAAKRILQKQCVITDIPNAALLDITNIWTMQIKLEDADNINDPERFVWEGIYRAAQDFMLLRGNFDPEIHNIAQRWLNAYEFYVPPQMRSRRSLLRQQEKENGKGHKKRKPSHRSEGTKVTLIKKTSARKDTKKEQARKERRSGKPSKRAAEAYLKQQK